MGFWHKRAANEQTCWVPKHTWETLGVQREPRGAQKGSKGNPRGAQGSPQGVQGDPKKWSGDPKRCPRESRGTQKAPVETRSGDPMFTWCSKLVFEDAVQRGCCPRDSLVENADARCLPNKQNTFSQHLSGNPLPGTLCPSLPPPKPMPGCVEDGAWLLWDLLSAATVVVARFFY
jgi:hypothetical protein